MSNTTIKTGTAGRPGPDKAEMTGAAYRLRRRDGEAEDVYFLVKDNEREFPIGLSDVLDCLKSAEAEGIVPPVPIPWWINTSGMYPGHEHWTDLPGKKCRK